MMPNQVTRHGIQSPSPLVPGGSCSCSIAPNDNEVMDDKHVSTCTGNDKNQNATPDTQPETPQLNDHDSMMIYAPQLPSEKENILSPLLVDTVSNTTNKNAFTTVSSSILLPPPPVIIKDDHEDNNINITAAADSSDSITSISSTKNNNIIQPNKINYDTHTYSSVQKHSKPNKRELLQAMRSTLATGTTTPPRNNSSIHHNISFDDTITTNKSELMKSFRSFIAIPSVDVDGDVDVTSDGGNITIDESYYNEDESILSYTSTKRDFFLNLRSLAESPTKEDKQGPKKGGTTTTIGKGNDTSFESRKDLFMSLRNNLATINNNNKSNTDTTSKNNNDTSFDSRADVLSSLRGIARSSKYNTDGNFVCSGNNNSFERKVRILRDIGNIASDECRVKTDINTSFDSKASTLSSLRGIASRDSDHKARSDIVTSIDDKASTLSSLRGIASRDIDHKAKSDIDTSIDNKASTLASLRGIASVASEEGKLKTDTNNNIGTNANTSSLRDTDNVASESKTKSDTTKIIDSKGNTLRNIANKANCKVKAQFGTDVSYESSASMLSFLRDIESTASSCALDLSYENEVGKEDSVTQNLLEDEANNSNVLSKISYRIASIPENTTPLKTNHINDENSPDSQISNVATTSRNADVNIVASLSQIGLSQIYLNDKNKMIHETPRTKNSSNTALDLHPVTIHDNNELRSHLNESTVECVEMVVKKDNNVTKCGKFTNSFSKAEKADLEYEQKPVAMVTPDTLSRSEKVYIQNCAPEPIRDNKLLVSPELEPTYHPIIEQDVLQDHVIQDVIADDLSEVSSLGNCSITSGSSHSKHSTMSQYLRAPRSRTAYKGWGKSRSSLEQIQSDLKKIALLAKADNNQIQSETLEQDISIVSYCSPQNKILNHTTEVAKIAPSKYDVQTKRRNLTNRARKSQRNSPNINNLSIYDGVMKGFKSLQNEIESKEREQIIDGYKFDCSENERLYNEFKFIEEQESKRRMDHIWSNMSSISAVPNKKQIKDELRPKEKNSKASVFAFPSFQNEEDDEEAFISLLNNGNSFVKDGVLERKKKTYTNKTNQKDIEGNQTKKKMKKKLLKKMKAILSRKKKSKSTDEQSILGISAIESYVEESDTDDKKEKKMRFARFRRKQKYKSSIDHCDIDDECNMSAHLEELMINLDIDPLNCSDFSISDSISEASETNDSYNFGYASLQ